VVKNPDDPLQEFGYSDLTPVLQKKYPKEIRFIAGYNKEAAKKTRRKRTMFIDWKFKEMAAVIEEEESLDGRYFIQTEVSKQIDKVEIERSYKSLQKVEQAFRIVKDEFDIRPIFVRKETRIRGHVMISYFSLLIETLMEKKVKEIFPQK